MRQLRALVALRWRMIRDRRVQVGLALLAFSLPLMVVIGTYAGQVARRTEFADNLRLLDPSLLLGFAALTLAGPLSNGGGAELFPQEQLVAYPVQPRATYLGSLASAPLNLAWATQVVALVTAGSFTIQDPTPLVVLSVATTLAFVAFTTAAGQAIGWWVVGVRQRRWGRVLARSLGALVFGGLAAVILTGHATALLDRSPTTRVTIASVNGAQGHWWKWAAPTLVLLAGAAIALRIGGRATTWSLRRPSDQRAEPISRRQQRRPLPRSQVGILLRTDRSSVWRSLPLRRGLLVLGLLPGAVAAAASTSWSSLALLPGLVAAGAGLLFGVNAFCLDGSGGLWLSSMPHSGRVSLAAKARVIAETCFVAVLVTVGVAGSRSPGVPTAAELSALLASVVATIALVVSTCLRMSVTRPHKADLRGPRDAPAPPAAMTVYSLRLALATTVVGSLFVGAGASGVAAAGPVLGLLVLAWVVRSLRKTFAAFDVSATRARVICVVANG
ncbi:MAG: hypothetical protein JWN31_1423 [Frankiales bacterium]|nr:hypothetical protein [Frankiales bacterium]